MAIYGLQTDFINKLLSEYFGIANLNLPESNDIFIGLGLTQQGANINMESFDEVFSGRSLGNYSRARVIFGESVNNTISNINDIQFNTALEDWTDPTRLVNMIGIFNTLDYEDPVTKTPIKPLIVSKLPTAVTVIKGDTILLNKNSINLSLTDI